MKPEPRLVRVCRISRGRLLIISEKLRVKIVERIAHRAPDDAFGIDVHDRWQNFGHGQHGRLRRGIGLREADRRDENANATRSDEMIAVVSARLRGAQAPPPAGDGALAIANFRFDKSIGRGAAMCRRGRLRSTESATSPALFAPVVHCAEEVTEPRCALSTCRVSLMAAD